MRDPFLHPFYSYLYGVSFIKGIIFAGTDLSKEMVKNADEKPKSLNFSMTLVTSRTLELTIGPT